jgi:hypothetical protein
MSSLKIEVLTHFTVSFISGKSDPFLAPKQAKIDDVPD